MCVGGGLLERKRRKVGRAERRSEKTSQGLSGRPRCSTGPQLGPYQERQEGLQEPTLMFPGGPVRGRPGDDAHAPNASQPARDADKGAQLWAHTAARNQISLPFSQTNQITSPPLPAERLLPLLHAHVRALSTRADRLSGLTSGATAPSSEDAELSADDCSAPDADANANVCMLLLALRPRPTSSLDLEGCRTATPPASEPGLLIGGTTPRCTLVTAELHFLLPPQHAADG